MERKAGVARWVCGRWTKWIVLAAWIVLTAIAGPLAGKLTGVQNNDTSQWLPSKAESTQAVRLQDKFQSGESAAVVVVYQRLSGITAADRAKAVADARALASVNGIAGAVTGPIPSADGKALQVVVPLRLGVNGWNKLPKRTDAIKKLTRSTGPGLTVSLAGAGAFYADSARAFSGIDSTLLIATVLVVIIALLIAYRSPVLWLLPVMSAFISLSSAEAFIYLLAKHTGLTVNGQSQGILTILVFGAATDYALLLISRYREELRLHEDRHEAMAQALRRAGPAIIASAATVVLGVLCLEFAEMNSTKGLGPVAAVGIAVGLIAMITLLPALLVIFGRWLFWPVKPVYGAQPRNRRSVWVGLGRRIAQRPRTIWIGSALVLAALSAGVFQLHATGLASQDSFTKKVESVIGQQVLSRHYPAGQDGEWSPSSASRS